MTTATLLSDVFGPMVILCPFVLLLLIGGLSLIGAELSEAFVHRVCLTTTTTGLAASLIVLGLMLAGGERRVPVEFGQWVHVEGFHLSIKFVFDRLSVPFAVMSYLLCGTIGSFATRYLHREPGYNRFFVLFALFLAGMIVTSLAGTIETLFAGWEFVGLSSALLVAFFQERPAPPRNGLRVWAVYRVSDAALLLSAVALHHLTGEGEFAHALGAGPWPEGVTALSPQHALLVGTLLLVAAAGKSALVPFSGWLPRAMEGPTPSSAVFYGALSVHLGAFLLLRVGALLDASPLLAALVTVLGLITALFAYVAGLVQTDIKSSLSFASLTQVGLIVAEIGLGLRYVALVHLIGHACLRTLQFLRAPNLLADYHALENALGERLPAAGRRRWWSRAIYAMAQERGYFDGALDGWIVGPFVSVFRWCNRQERRWTNWLAGEDRRTGGRAP